MTVSPGSGGDPPVGAARTSANPEIPADDHPRPARSETDHPRPARSDDHPRPARPETDLDGTERVSGLVEWRPGYQHEVAVVGWVRQVSYRNGSQDTPAAVLRIDNPEGLGEVAMTAEDLGAFVDLLLDLQRTLLATRGDGAVPEPRTEADGD